MVLAASGDQRFDPALPEQPPVFVVVIASVGPHEVGFLAWATVLAGDRPGVQGLQQRDQLGDVVAMPTGQSDRERDPGGVDQQMVF